MDFLKDQVARFWQQLGGLSASQKMLTVTLIAIMVMTLLWWGRYAGTPELEAVVDQDVSAEELGRMKMAVMAKGVPFQVLNGRLMVPAERKLEVVADLIYAGSLPANSEAAFDEITRKMNSPWNSEKTNG